MRALIFLLAFTTLNAQAWTGTPNEKEETWQGYLKFRNSDSVEGMAQAEKISAAWFFLGRGKWTL